MSHEPPRSRSALKDWLSMTRFTLTTLSISFLCLALSGCSETAPAPAAAELKPIQSDSLAQATFTDVSKEQAEEFGKKLQSAIENGDAEAASKFILLDRVLDRIDLKLNLPKVLRDELRKAFDKKNPFTVTFKQVIESNSQGAAYKLVRTAVRGDEMHAIFRLTDPNQGMNYHDLRLVMDDGTVKADQIFIAATGESFTDSLINIIGPAVRAQQSALGRLSGEAARKAKEVDKQGKMAVAAQTGNAEEALAIYETMPTEIKKTKLVQFSRVMASQTQSEEKYLAAMTEYANLFPNDPSVALMSFDKAVLNEDIDALKKCFATLNTWTGGDNYLNLMTSALAATWGHTDYAKQLYENVDATTAGISEAHHYKMSAAILCDDFAIAAEELRILREDYGMEIDFESDPAFADFLKSPEYAAVDSN